MLDDHHFQLISRALADPRRLEILQILGRHREHPCSALCEELPITQATLSHHLKELSEAGLIRVRREAKFAHLSLEKKALKGYMNELARRTGLR